MLSIPQPGSQLAAQARHGKSRPHTCQPHTLEEPPQSFPKCSRGALQSQDGWCPVPGSDGGSLFILGKPGGGEGGEEKDSAGESNDGHE